MNVGTGIDKARAKLARRAHRFMADLCTIQSPGTATGDAYGDSSSAPTDVETNFPCEAKALSAYERSAGGSVAANASYKIKLPATVTTQVITGGYKLLFNARANGPQRTFDVTGQLTGSRDRFVYLAATERT